MRLNCVFPPAAASPGRQFRCQRARINPIDPAQFPVPPIHPLRSHPLHEYVAPCSNFSRATTRHRPRRIVPPIICQKRPCLADQPQILLFLGTTNRPTDNTPAQLARRRAQHRVPHPDTHLGVLVWRIHRQTINSDNPLRMRIGRMDLRLQTPTGQQWKARSVGKQDAWRPSHPAAQSAAAPLIGKVATTRLHTVGQLWWTRFRLWTQACSRARQALREILDGEGRLPSAKKSVRSHTAPSVLSFCTRAVVLTYWRGVHYRWDRPEIVENYKE